MVLYPNKLPESERVCFGICSIKHELAPISFKQAFTESSQEEQLPHGVALLFPNGLRAHFGSGSEDLLKEIFTQSLRDGHV